MTEPSAFVPRPERVIDLTDADAPMRLERDALGPRALPRDARYGIHTLRAVEMLTVSRVPLGNLPALVTAIGQVKQATARANADAGVLTRDEARAIDAAAARLVAVDADLRPDLPADPLAGGGSIAVHMNVNEVLANLANESLGRPYGAYDPVTPKAHVSASQSTADVMHTAYRLAALSGVEQVLGAIAGLVATLGDRARDFRAHTTLGRTCLQDAMPVPAHLLVEGTAAALERRRVALDRHAAGLAGVTLGSTVIGTGAGAPPHYRDRVVPHLCATTGRSLSLHPARASALQHSDDLVALVDELAGVASITTKLARDLRLLGSGPLGGFGELRLPHVLEGSSFFGDKRNPVVAESMINAGTQVAGHAAAVRAAADLAELHLQVFDNVAAVNALAALDLLARAITAFDHHCVRGVELDLDRLAALAATAAAAAAADTADTGTLTAEPATAQPVAAQEPRP